MPPRKPGRPPGSPGPQDTQDTQDDKPAVPVKSLDDSDIGWGELPDREHDDRLREDRPPHWDE